MEFETEFVVRWGPIEKRRLRLIPVFLVAALVLWLVSVTILYHIAYRSVRLGPGVRVINIYAAFGWVVVLLLCLSAVVTALVLATLLLVWRWAQRGRYLRSDAGKHYALSPDVAEASRNAAVAPSSWWPVVSPGAAAHPGARFPRRMLAKVDPPPRNPDEPQPPPGQRLRQWLIGPRTCRVLAGDGVELHVGEEVALAGLDTVLDKLGYSRPA